LAGFAAATVSGGAAGNPSVTLPAAADAYVRADRPLENYGKGRTIAVADTPTSTAYLRFTVSVPAGQAVVRATLRLFALAGPRATLGVHRVASPSWSEAGVTFRKAPRVGATATTASVPRHGRGYVAIDVSRLITRSGGVSFALTATSSSPFRFKSRESGSGRPQLVIQTAAGSDRTTIPATVAPTTAASASNGPCGTAAAPPATVDHVVWIWMENKPYEAIAASSSAPFENALANECGIATNYHGVAHPSLPNYIAATSGDIQGIGDDEPPASHPLGVASIYGQLKAAGKTWRDYAESSPGNCSLTPNGLYAVKHDPAPYYTGIRSDCADWDVPMGTIAGGSFLNDLTAGTLPSFSFVTPDLCNDTHDCSVATGDAWLSSWFDKILSSPAYVAGKTVIFIVWDEDDGSPANHVPLIVVAPSVRPGTQPAALFDHYALLKSTEQLLGVTSFLGHAGDPGTSSMLAAFNLG
jgi:hypothetical protein